MATEKLQPQMIPANTWTVVLGTDTEVFVRTGEHVKLEVETFQDKNGEEFVQITGYMNSGGAMSLRSPTTRVRA